MAKKKRSPKLSLGELKIVGILWERGPSTLAEVYQLQTSQLAYTTIQTQLNRLVAKRLVARTKVRPMKYRAIVDPQTTAAGLLRLLVETAGGGSIIPLVALLVSQANLSKEDVRELKDLIDRAGPKRPKPSKSTAKRPKKRS